MFVVDTNVVSELRLIERANRNVVAWAESVPVDELYLSAVTIMELELGAWQIARKNPGKAKELSAWVEGYVLPRFDGRILTFDAAIARRCALLHVPNRRPERDAMIAATALVHGMAVVTRNVADFSSMGVPLFNPWDKQPTGFHEQQAVLE